VNTTLWKAGAVVRTLVVAYAILVVALSTGIAFIARSSFVALSSGVWLTLVARYVYGVEREPATYATDTLTLTNAGGGVYNLDPGDLTISNGEVEYTNADAFTLGALTSVDVTIVCKFAGSIGTTGAATITTMVTALDGVTCTNASPLVGVDEQSDVALRTVCSESLGSKSPNGPRDAYSFFAKAAELDGVSLGVTRVRSFVASDTGVVTTYVATATGALTGDADDPETQLGACADNVWRNAVPLAVTSVVENADEVEVDITYQVWVWDTGGIVEADLTEAIEEALATAVSTLPIGGIVIGSDPGMLFVEQLRRTINAVDSRIFRVVVTLPVADVEIDPEQATVIGTVTGAVTRVPVQ
jgi:hypothetical protein